MDLYGEQIGGRLEDMLTFAKYLGGSPANTAIGVARLGLKPAMLTRVGDEHNGRFVRETLAAEGVDVSHVITDPKRLTALAILGIRDRETFPLLFYREHCADMNIAAGDFDAQFIASSIALCVSGTHLSQPQTYAACVAAMQQARNAGTRVALDIDYRPVLWGLTSPGLGEQRYVQSDEVSAHLQTVIPLCDLVVGTEEEIHIAGGSTDTIAALRRLRELTPGTLVVKRGPDGLRRVSGGRFRTTSRTGSRVRAFPSTSTTSWAPATRSWRASCAAGFAMSRWNAAAPTPTRAARWSCRGMAARPAMPSWIELSASSSTARRRAGCAKTRSWNGCIATRRARAIGATSPCWRSTIARSSSTWRRRMALGTTASSPARS